MDKNTSQGAVVTSPQKEQLSEQTFPLGEFIKDIHTLEKIVGTYVGLYGNDPDKGIAEFFDKFDAQKLKEISENLRTLVKKGSEYIPGMDNTLKITEVTTEKPVVPHKAPTGANKAHLKI